MKTGAVVVAAGLSSRMKSFKPMLQLSGSTVIRTAVSALRSAGVSPVVVVIGKNAEKLRKHLSDLDVIFVYNKNYASTDMYHSACMGLKSIHGKTDRVFFLPGDVPLFSRNSLFTMMGYMDYSSCSILIPAHNGKKGHPVLIKSDVIPQLVSYKGGEGLKGAIEAFAGAKDVIELPDMGLTIDADRPEDYQLLQSYAKSLALKKPVECSVKVSLQRKETFFDDKTAALLQQVARTGSLAQACCSMGISYSHGWKLVKIAESQLAFSLLDSRSGGAYGGGSSLTKEAKGMLEAYHRFKQEVVYFSELNFHKFFYRYQKEAR